jgi:glucose/arabinose dehydrogenase
LRDESLYFATNDAVLRFRIPSGALESAGPPDTIVRELPVGGHAAKSIALGGDDALYVNVGSRTNSCQQQDRQSRSPGQEPCAELGSRAGIWRFSATRPNQRQADGTRFATGLRNVVALTVHPGSGEVYGAQHGRDMLAQNWGFTVEASAELPSEELVHIRQGNDFGWPYCYNDHLQGKRVLAPEYGGDGREVGQCAGKQQPLVAFPGHWAPNGLTFYARDQFPQHYRGGAFIAFHGSWNRAPLPQAGFKVVFQPFAGGEPNGPHEVFADGFTGVGARPTGLAIGPDGSLFISADTGQRIWRVLYRAQP